MTDLEIANLALVMNGEPKVISIANLDSSASPNQVRCDTTIQVAMDWCISQHLFHCAKRRALLNPDATAPAFGFTYQFTLPADHLRTYIVCDSQGNPYSDGWEPEDGKLLSMYNPLGIIYVRSLSRQEASKMPVYLAHAVAALQAYWLAQLIGAEDAKTERLQKSAEVAMMKAKNLSATDGPRRTLSASTEIDARHLDQIPPWPIVQ